MNAVLEKIDLSSGYVDRIAEDMSVSNPTMSTSKSRKFRTSARIGDTVRCIGAWSGNSATSIGKIIFMGQFFITTFNGHYNESFFHWQIAEILQK